MTGEGLLGNARPCYNCLNIMKIVGIKRVYYSLKPDVIVCEKVKDMISIQASNVCKLINRRFYHAPISDNDFFKNLLKELFPPIIKEENLNCFLKYNFKVVLPDYNYKIIKSKTFSKIIFLDENNCPFHESEIITK